MLLLSYCGSAAMNAQDWFEWLTVAEICCATIIVFNTLQTIALKGLRSPFSVRTRQMKLLFYPRVNEWQAKGMFACYYGTKLHCGIFSSLSTNAFLCKIRIFILINHVALNGCLFKHPSIRKPPCHTVNITQPSAHWRAQGMHGQRPESVRLHRHLYSDFNTRKTIV